MALNIFATVTVTAKNITQKLLQNFFFPLITINALVTTSTEEVVLFAPVITCRIQWQIFLPPTDPCFTC